jgi:DnaJ-class molecular chaperone
MFIRYLYDTSSRARLKLRNSRRRNKVTGADFVRIGREKVGDLSAPFETNQGHVSLHSAVRDKNTMSLLANAFRMKTTREETIRAGCSECSGSGYMSSDPPDAMLCPICQGHGKLDLVQDVPDRRLAVLRILAIGFCFIVGGIAAYLVFA